MIIYPPEDEQIEIKDYLIKSDDAFFLVIENTLIQIENSKEYRTALITNAVTVKIDVRNEVE